MAVAAKADAGVDFKEATQRVLAKMLGERFVFPTINTAAGELKAAYSAFMEGIAKAGRQDAEVLSLLADVANQSRMLGERETGKDFGAKLAEAYCDLVEFRSSL